MRTFSYIVKSSSRAEVKNFSSLDYQNIDLFNITLIRNKSCRDTANTIIVVKDSVLKEFQIK